MRDIILGILAFALLLISISFNFKHYKYIKTFGFIYKYDVDIDLKPSLLSTTFAIFLFGGFIARNINEILKKEILFLFIIIDIIFFSGLISIFFSSKDTFLGFSPQALLLLAIIFMWVGMRCLTRYLLFALILISFFHISHVNDAMGFDGSLYILFAFLSFLIQMYLNVIPNTNIKSIKTDFIGEKY